MLKFIIAFCALTMSGCALWQSDNDDPTAPMDVTVDFENRHRCSRISPEIKLAGIPKETAEFDVKLEDILDQRRFYGGGQWTNDNSGTIPEGALTKRYSGPCPENSNPRYYHYTVTAKDKNGNILANKIAKVAVE